jgi:hypothetical protein
MRYFLKIPYIKDVVQGPAFGASYDPALGWPFNKGSFSV